MKQLTALEFVIDAINRHYVAHGCRPMRVQVSPEFFREMCCAASAAQLILICCGEMPTVCGVQIDEVPGILPRLIRFDGVTEDM